MIRWHPFFRRHVTETPPLLLVVSAHITETLFVSWGLPDCLVFQQAPNAQDLDDLRNTIWKCGRATCVIEDSGIEKRRNMAILRRAAELRHAARGYPAVEQKLLAPRKESRNT